VALAAGFRTNIMRTKFIAGNWKMYTNLAAARQLAAAIAKGVGVDQQVRVAVCPPFPYLFAVGEELRGSAVLLGAQNAYEEKEGAFTGEVSPAMLADAGCRYVILGHSERRHKLGESDAFINRKVHAALGVGLQVILCLGETRDERQANRTEAVLEAQLNGGLAGLDAAKMANVVLAYEPVWAIGTGQHASPQQAQDAHGFLRKRIAEKFGEETAARLPILYGGSAKPENVETLLHLPDVDGGLIGGASLKANDFLTIIRLAGPRG
jgi:triosephosphate isomerase